MADGCRQEKGVSHVRVHDDRHTGLPRSLPQPRRPPGLLRRPVGDPAARRGNATHGGVSAVFRGGARHAKVAQVQAQHMFYKRAVGRGPASFFGQGQWCPPTWQCSPDSQIQHGRHHDRCHNGNTWRPSGYDLSETCKKATDIYAILAVNLEHLCRNLHSIDCAPQLLVTQWLYDPE